MDGHSFVWEVNGVGTDIFGAYLGAFSKVRPKEYKILVIDNAGFHSTKNIGVPDNICLVRIPPYSPELNPCEQVWKYIKQRYKNRQFHCMEKLREWLGQQVRMMDPRLIQSITSNHHYKNAFISVFFR